MQYELDISATRPRVSVVIPVRNGEEVMSRQLEALATQTYDGPWEIIVSDNGSTDQTVAVIRCFQGRLPMLSIVDSSRKRGINHARNVGVAASRGDFILFCDSDDSADAGWVKAMVDAFERGANLVGGRLQVVASFGKPIGFGPENGDVFGGGLGFLRFPAGANCGISRKVWEQVGSFDEDFLGGGDEADYFWRAQLEGFQMLAVRDAVIDYYQRTKLGEVYRQAVGYGRSHVRLFIKYKQDGMPRKVGFGTARAISGALAKMARSPGTESIARLVFNSGITMGRLREGFGQHVFYL